MSVCCSTHCAPVGSPCVGSMHPPPPPWNSPILRSGRKCTDHHSIFSLIRQGTSIRRTNETDMNAQSSRSHAIFSLTLIQKKFTGSGPPPRSSSPLPPGGRSPSRIGRPGSVIGPAGSSSRVSSPTFGRPSTPSFQSAIARGGRPASSLGLLSPDMGRNGASKDTGDASGGEWVTVVSKFHFVDLAGSERVREQL